MQIVGGIWADKLGGKVVLGFGVVWWSIATVLTPFAARLGLPFLLVVRALMGIGEVSLYMLFPCFFQNLDTADFPNIVSCLHFVCSLKLFLLWTLKDKPIVSCLAILNIVDLSRYIS